MVASLLGACDANRSSPTPALGDGAAAVRGAGRSARAVTVVRAQEAALHSGRLHDFAATWSRDVAAARRQGRIVARDLRALGVAHIRCLHVVPATGGRTPVAGPPGRESWRRHVEVTWRPAGDPARNVVSTLTYTFVVAKGRAAVLDVAAAPGSREPIWLLGRLHVRRGRGGVVAVAPTPDGAAEVAHRLQVSRRDVLEVFPRWTGGLTAYLPATLDDFDAILGAARGEYDGIAAVTAPVNGSRDARASLVIVLNPKIWPLLRSVGAHVLVTHEAVHVATRSVTGHLPRWVTEGFADDVAVRAARVPIAMAGAAALRGVRSHGLPGRLPAGRDFATADAQLERSYELARLAVVAIRRHDGQHRLVDFYRDVVAHPAHLGRALRRRLDTSRAVLTQQWRRLLERLVGAR